MQGGGALVAVATAVWRLGVAVVAFYGWWDGGADLDRLPILPQLGSLLVAGIYAPLAISQLVVTLVRNQEPWRGMVRGAVAVLMALIGIVYWTQLDGDIVAVEDKLTYAVTPLLVLFDWCFIGQGQNRTRWWHPLFWLMPPAAYLAWYTRENGFGSLTDFGDPIYATVLNPEADNYVTGMVTIGVVVVVASYFLYGLAKIKGIMSASVRYPEHRNRTKGDVHETGLNLLRDFYPPEADAEGRSGQPRRTSGSCPQPPPPAPWPPGPQAPGSSPAPPGPAPWPPRPPQSPQQPPSQQPPSQQPPPRTQQPQPSPQRSARNQPARPWPPRPPSRPRW